MIRVLLAVSDPHLSDHISGLVAESDELVVASTLRNPTELRGMLPRADVDAIVLHDHTGSLPSIEIARELTVAHPDVGLVLVVTDDSPEVLRRGMQAGARDVVSVPVGLEQLETSVVAAASWTQALRRRAERDAGGELHGTGRVITVVGAKGGVGTTTIATHLALAARGLSDASVCLVEYDLQMGDLRAYLDLPYRRSVADLVPVSEELTTRHLQETLYSHASGMRVLLAPQDGEQAETVTAAAARNILTAIRTREDLTIVDAGAMLTEASAIAAEMADTVIVVSTPDVVSLRGVVRLYAMWERLRVQPPEVAVLLNRASRKLEVQADLARRVVPVPVLQTSVRADFFALESAVNTGIPATESTTSAMLEPMASVLGELSALPASAPEPGSDRARSILARFAGESGQATVEFAGTLPVALGVAVLVWQVVLIAMTFVFAGHAARTGARALAVGDAVQPAALSDLPSAWRGGSTVDPPQEPSGGQVSSAGDLFGSVTVKVRVPLLVPGLLDNLLPPVNASAGTVIEATATPTEGFAFGAGAGVTPGGGPAIVGTALLHSPFSHIIPGDVPMLEASGFLDAPANAPQIIQIMIAAANEINHTSYLYGGGHGPMNQLYSAYDCSSSTSFVLYAAGLLTTPDAVVSGAMGTAVARATPGPGHLVTVYYNAGHTHIEILGYNFDTIAGSENAAPQPPPSGPRWVKVGGPINTGDYGPDYNEDHPAGM